MTEPTDSATAESSTTEEAPGPAAPSAVPARGRSVGPRRPSAAPVSPKSRPTWLVLLSSLTLVYGGLLLVSGLNGLRDPIAAARAPLAQPMPPEQEALTRQLAEVGLRILTGHVVGIRLRAAGSLLLALALLYAAAAALSRDRHGRTVTLVAAWMGIAYQLGSLPVVVPIARDYALATAPMLAAAIAADPPRAPADGGKAVDPPKPEAVAGVMRSVFVGIPIVTALVGIAGSALLIVFYGGRRGRALYGLLPP